MTEKEKFHSSIPTAASATVIPAPINPTKTLSGSAWCKQFPGSKNADDLNEPFRQNFYEFYVALERAGCKISISATYRPPLRAHLMHYAWLIHHQKNFDYKSIPIEAGVDIEWDHGDENKSRSAAADMCLTYDINGQTTPPSLTSNHFKGHAVDMNINWEDVLSIEEKGGSTKEIKSEPKNGMNKELQEVAAGYGVIKFNVSGVVDKPHWAINTQ